jgi:hypothetical protein
MQNERSIGQQKRCRMVSDAKRAMSIRKALDAPGGGFHAANERARREKSRKAADRVYEIKRSADDTRARIALRVPADVKSAFESLAKKKDMSLASLFEASLPAMGGIGCDVANRKTGLLMEVSPEVGADFGALATNMGMTNEVLLETLLDTLKYYDREMGGGALIESRRLAETGHKKIAMHMDYVLKKFKYCAEDIREASSKKSENAPLKTGEGDAAEKLLGDAACSKTR